MDKGPGYQSFHPRCGDVCECFSKCLKGSHLGLKFPLLPQKRAMEEKNCHRARQLMSVRSPQSLSRHDNL